MSWALDAIAIGERMARRDLPPEAATEVVGALNALRPAAPAVERLGTDEIRRLWAHATSRSEHALVTYLQERATHDDRVAAVTGALEDATTAATDRAEVWAAAARFGARAARVAVGYFLLGAL